MAKGVYTFICKQSGKNWTAKQRSGDIEDSAPTTYELERKLVKAAVAADSSGAAVRSSFSMITPKSAIFQVIIGGATFVGGDVTAAAAAPTTAAAGGAAAAPAEDKKKEEEAEESDGDLGFSLFD